MIRYKVTTTIVEVETSETEVDRYNNAKTPLRALPSRAPRTLHVANLPAVLVPSSTPGHSHLYLDVRVSEGSVRLPWIRKVPATDSGPVEVEQP